MTPMRICLETHLHLRFRGKLGSLLNDEINLTQKRRVFEETCDPTLIGLAELNL